MITFKASSFNHYSQSDYESDISSLDISIIECPFCHESHVLIFYGHYHRKYFSLVDDSLIELRIHRVLCKHCHKSHALLPDGIVPYRRFSLAHLIAFASCDVAYQGKSR